MAAGHQHCRLCYRSTIDPRFLPNCKHSFCLGCIASYYDHRQRTSVMRIAAIPCPDLYCRQLSEVPRGGVRDFPSSPDEERTDPEEPEVDQETIPETIRRSPKSSEGKLKKRVTFSDQENSSDSGGTPVFRSTASFIIGRHITHQQGVDIPDSALVLTTPDTGSGSDGMERKRFRFPSVASVSSEPDINGNETKRMDSSDDVVVENRIEPYVRTSQTTTNNRWLVMDNDNPNTPSQQPELNHQEPNRSPSQSYQETLAAGVVLCWRVAKTAHHKPTSIVLTSSQGHAIVADYGKGTVEYLDASGQTTLSINTLKPFAVHLTPSGSVVVGDRRTKTLVFLEGPTAEIVSQWETGCFEWVGGLGSLRNGNLVVADRSDCRIGVYTPDGRRVSEFGSYGTGGDNICMADFLAVDSRDRIIVSDSANHCVKVFDAASGSSLTRFSGRGSTDGLLAWPKGVCVDRLDNIIVADSKNGRLSSFSPSGDFIEHLVSGVRSPFGVCCLAESDMVGVTHYSLSGYSQLDVYRLNQDT